MSGCPQPNSTASMSLTMVRTIARTTLQSGRSRCLRRSPSVPLREDGPLPCCRTPRRPVDGYGVAHSFFRAVVRWNPTNNLDRNSFSADDILQAYLGYAGRSSSSISVD